MFQLVTVPRLVTGALAALLIAVTSACSGPASAVPAATSRAPAPTGPASTRAAVTGCGASPAVTRGSTAQEHVTVDGQDRTYFVHVPDGYRATQPTPVVLAFPGHGMAPQTLEGFSGLDAASAVVVYPQGEPGTDGHSAWQGAPYASGADDVAFVGAVLDQVESRFCVDAARVDAIGISNGGGFTSLLSCALPDRIAAFAVVAGAVYEGTDPTCPGSRPVPVIEFHGTADPVMHLDGGTSHGTAYDSVATWLDQQAQRDRCSATPTTTEVADDVTRQDWSGCAPGGALTAYTVTGGGHTWPGAQERSGPGATTTSITATSLALRFFAQHPLRQ